MNVSAPFSRVWIIMINIKEVLDINVYITIVTVLQSSKHYSLLTVVPIIYLSALSMLCTLYASLNEHSC